MRILIVKLSSFGDVVHTFPAVSDLAAARPDIEIDWLVEEAFLPFVALHPAIGQAHPVTFRRLRWPPRRWPLYAPEVVKLIWRLRARRYDRIVDMQGLLKSALGGLFAGFTLSGYDRASAREPSASAFYRHRYAVPPGMQAVERGRRLLAAAVGYDLPAGLGRFGLAVPARPKIAGLPARYILAVHATSWPSKHWPEAHWRRLLSRFAADGRAFVLPWGTQAERARAERLADGISGAFVLPKVLAGADLAGLIGGADCAVGVDSGLMHIAAALGVPGVWLFGPTDPGLTGPYGGGQTVIRSIWPEAPCRRRTCDRTPDGLCCMRAIEVDRVAEAVGKLPVARP